MVNLRLANESDLPLIMAWRSHPDNYRGFFTQKSALTWAEHYNWWITRSSEWREFIILYENRPVGIVTVGWLHSWTPEIGYCVGETTLWGKGVGKKAVSLTLDWLKEQGKEYCHTTVLKDNTRSLKLLDGLGFKVLGDAREGEVWLTKKL